MIKVYIGLHVKYLLLLLYLKVNLIFVTPISDFMEIRSVGADLFTGQMEEQTENKEIWWN